MCYWTTNGSTKKLKKKYKISETYENQNTKYQNLWDAAKAALKGKFIAINAYLQKQEKFSNNLTLNLKELEI